ncbi:MAG: hypothetical protein ACREGK_07185 [Geminicoccales bacterium]
MLVEMKRSAAVNLVLASILMAARAFGHHGWSGYTEDDFTLTGVVEEVTLGGAYGELKLRAPGGIWEVVLGPPFRNQRAGITAGVIAIGDTVTAHGHRHVDPGLLEIKTERLELGEKVYEIHSDR